MPAGATDRLAHPERELRPNQIDVWTFTLAAPRGARRAEARRTRDELLASYLGVAPEQLTFGRSPTGKPALVDQSLRFNLSHSNDRALLAVSRAIELGIDLDHPRRAAEHRRGIDLQQALRDRCSAREARLVRHASDPEAAFTRLWVRKEAVVKAAGVGVLDQLAAIDVSEERVLATEGTLPDAWRCVDLPAPTPDYFAALAYPDGARPTLRQLTFSPESGLRR